MPNPTKYQPSYSFSGFQTSSPSKPLPAPMLDNELANIAQSLGQTIDGLAEIRRSDGKLKNEVVTLLSLSDEVRAAIDANGEGGSGGGGTPGGPIAITDVTGLRSELDAQRANLLALDDEIDDKVSGQQLATALASKQAVLGFTPEDVTNKGQPGGYAALGDDGKVPAAQLPPAGETGHVLYAGNVRNYGAKGDNATDDTAAFEAAIAANQVVYAPAGIYILKRRLSKDGPLVLFGDGQLLTKLVWSGSSSSGIASTITTTGADTRETCQIRGLALLAREYVPGSIALSVKRGNFAGEVASSLLMRDVFIGRENNAFTQGWTVHVDLDACCNTFIDTCFIAGKITGGSGGGEPNYDSTFGIRYHNDSGAAPHATVLNVTNTEIFHCKQAISSYDMEGLLVNGCQIVGCNYGVVGQGVASYGDPHFSVIGTHINCSVRAIWVRKMSQIVIIGNVLYSQLTKDSNSVQIEVGASANLVKIIGNDFENLSSDYTATSVGIDGTLYGAISGNTFRRTGRVGGPAAGTAIYLGSAAQEITIGADNVFSAEVGQRIVDNGQRNMQPGLGARFRRSGGIGLSPGSLNIIPFDQLENVRGNPGDDMSDGVWTCASAGLWTFTASVQCSGDGAGGVILNMQKNATAGNPIAGYAADFGAGSATVLYLQSGPIWMERNDTIRVGVNPSINRSVLAGTSTFFDARRLA